MLLGPSRGNISIQERSRGKSSRTALCRSIGYSVFSQVVLLDFLLPVYRRACLSVAFVCAKRRTSIALLTILDWEVTLKHISQKTLCFRGRRSLRVSSVKLDSILFCFLSCGTPEVCLKRHHIFDMEDGPSVVFFDLLWFLLSVPCTVCIALLRATGDRKGAR